MSSGRTPAPASGVHEWTDRRQPTGSRTLLLTETLEERVRAALAGRYEIEGFLGAGGMGVVYAARDLRLERRVAIKVAPPDRAADPAFRARFLKEARIAAGLVHPNIVPIYAVHEVGDLIFFAMAYVAGQTLAWRISREGPLAAVDAARLLHELADALAYAHARGVVHRDVKPDNILLDATTGRALLSDFGIAHVGAEGTAAPSSSSGSVFGTAAFMSPEQGRGRAVDARSDLYSLGVVGYYALAGYLPFIAATDAELVHLHATAAAPPLRVPGVPRRLAQVVERCLEKDPQARFPDGAALGRALATALPGPPPAPIAVRAFMTRGVHLAGPALLYEAIVGLAAMPATLWSWIHAPELAAPATAGLTVAVALPCVVMWSRARRLLADGHGWADLVDALAAERERHLEELRFVYGEGASRFERGAQWLARLATAAAAALVIAPPPVRGLPAFAGAAAIAVVAAVVARARAEQRTDPRGARRLRFWAGPLGRGVFRLAALGKRQPGAGAPGGFSRLPTPA